jgi:hypothetical protein
MKIINDEEINEWTFNHSVIMGNICDAIKGTVCGEEDFNIAFVDRTTGEKIDIIYEC